MSFKLNVFVVAKRSGRPPKVVHQPDPNLLFLGSNPQKSPPLFDDSIDEKRKIYCRRYENCLDYAIDASWESFTCEDCGIEEGGPPTIDP